ncbi:MAG: hypothetical protein REI09_08175 [Candidatus Dactylopiibacterium sp.]|nr:hypothetical protein [Candidatus Dactylopiibacterium sp.]
MPVDLTGFPAPRECTDKAPSVVVWLSLLLLFMLGGTLIAVLVWPRDGATHGGWFWACALVLPMGLWSCALGVRLGKYLQARADTDAVNAALAERRDEFICRGQRPAFVHASSCTGQWGGSFLPLVMGRNRGDQETGPKSLVRPEDAADEARLALACEAALRPMLPDLQRGTAQGQLVVWLLVDFPGLDEMAERNAWDATWQKLELPGQPSVAAVERVPPSAGLAWLEAWLDDDDVDRSRALHLLVVVRLGHAYAATHSEWTGAFLLGRTLHQRGEGTGAVRIHRPVTGPVASLGQTLTTAQEWACCRPEDLHWMWYCGDGSGHSEALAELDGQGRRFAVDQGEGEVVLERFVSPCSAASVWMLIAFAVERAAQANGAQLVCAGSAGWCSAALVVSTGAPGAPDVAEAPQSASGV